MGRGGLTASPRGRRRLSRPLGTPGDGGQGEVSGGAGEPFGGHQAEAAVSSMKLCSRQVAMRLSLLAFLLKAKPE